MPKGNILGYLLPVSLWLCSVLTVIAQPETVLFREFSDNHGLPNNQFRKTLQDRDGIIWMGGGDGLAKYDGYVFTTFRYSNVDTTSICSNNISELFEDSRGRLWVGTYGGGLSISNPAKSKFSQIIITENDTTDGRDLLVTNIVEDDNGLFWVITTVGLYILEESENTFRVLELNVFLPDLSHYQPKTLYADQHERVWIGTDAGLFIYHSGDNKVEGPAEIPGVPHVEIGMVGIDREGRVWLTCHGPGPRLFYSDADQLDFRAFNGIPIKSDKRAVLFAFDLDNRLWLGEFANQFFGYDFRDSTVFLKSSVNSSVPFERFVRAPFVDHSGNVWLPFEGYLIYPYPKGFKTYLHPYTFHQSVTAIYGRHNERWIAYREHGVVKINTETGERVHYSSSNKDHWIPSDLVVDMLHVRSGNLILVGFDHIAVMNPAGKVIASHQSAGTNRAGFEDSAGRIWIGGFGGLHLFSESEGILDTLRLPRNIGDSRMFIQSIIEDEAGNIWFASDLNGIGRLNYETNELVQFLPVRGDSATLPSSSIEELILDHEGMIWAASDIALIRIDPHSMEMKTYDRRHGLQSDYISAVLCDQNGVIWVSTHSGISSFDPGSHEVANYATADGLLNYSYYGRSAWMSDDGLLYFGGSHGMDYFKPGTLRKNPTAPLMYLSEITIDKGQVFHAADIVHPEGLKLTYRNDLLTISFSGIYYASPESVRYWYKMEGLRDEWVALGSRHEAVFTDLKPGDYRFRAKAISPDGVWSERELDIPIHISPPFFETMWFRILAVCLLGALLFGIIKYREQGIKLRQRHEAEVSHKIAELEKRALQAQMNPHFIYNCMNSIQQFMVVQDFEGAMKYLTRFSRILRSVLNMSAQSRVSLTDEIKLIEDYLELENMRFPNKFSYRFNIAPDLNVHTIEIPPFFIQPQVENAIRHGLLRKEGGGLLVLHISKEEKYLRVTVEDNGIGRSASRAIRLSEPHRESKGLSIVQERLSHLHQANGIHPLTITDLYDEAQNPIGTKVEVYLPLDA